MKHGLTAALVVVLIGPHAAQAYAPLQSSPAAVHASTWDALAALEGSWRLVNPGNEAEKAFRISFRPISRSTALVETFGNPAKNVTETIYHRDGEGIMATHYCNQGNQPRLRLDGASRATRLSFSFLDITNLKSPAASHLVKLEIRMLGPDLMERLETYSAAGVLEESKLTLRRAP